MLGYHDKSRWIRYARTVLRHLFRYLPKQPGYNKRLRALGAQMTHLVAVLAADADLWRHPIRVADSTPVRCGASRTTARNCDLAGYGYCASHSRRFWGLRLHLVTTMHGLPVASSGISLPWRSASYAVAGGSRLGGRVLACAARTSP